MSWTRYWYKPIAASAATTASAIMMDDIIFAVDQAHERQLILARRNGGGARRGRELRGCHAGLPRRSPVPVPGGKRSRIVMAVSSIEIRSCVLSGKTHDGVKTCWDLLFESLASTKLRWAVKTFRIATVQHSEPCCICKVAVSIGLALKRTPIAVMVERE